jgi:hypothetical protein
MPLISTCRHFIEDGALLPFLATRNFPAASCWAVPVKYAADRREEGIFNRGLYNISYNFIELGKNSSSPIIKIHCAAAYVVHCANDFYLPYLFQF